MMLVSTLRPRFVRQRGAAVVPERPVTLAVTEPLSARRLHVNRSPRCMHTVGDTAGIADQARCRPMLADADQDAVAGGPRASDRMRLHVRQQLIVDPLRGPPQRELTQSGQVAGLEIVPDCPLGLMR